ncbi:hypothetical protein V8J36_22645, partial [Frigidibacter sp. MR17.14]|uniref:hypothetical protein n=1 Tax=Frigidibacter sp. MR17.14 TaxID=3126509 RepID=UPI003012B1D2
FAIGLSSAGHSGRGADARHALRSNPDHPFGAGHPVPAAPARTSGFRVTQQRMIVGGSAVRSGFQGPRDTAPRRTLAVADVFDRMIRDARDRHEADQPSYVNQKGEVVELPFVAPFSPGQADMGRHYRALVEQRAAAGVKCASLEAGRAGGEGGGFMDAFLDVGRELAAIERRIGAGFAMEVRRVRPSNRGGAGARTITDRALVDMVCLGDRTLSEVLKAHGWSADGKNREKLKRALSSALSRMQGHSEKGD